MVAERSRLVAISIVTKGAEPDSSLSIAAQAAKEDSMKFEKWLEARGFDRESLEDSQEETLKAAFEADTADNEPEPTENEDSGVDLKAASEEAVKSVRDAVSKEEQRLDKVRSLCAEYSGKVDEEKVSELKAEAISGDIDVKDLELALLRAKRPAAGANVHTSGDHASDDKVIECALSQSSGVDEKSLEDDYEEPVLEAAHKEVSGGYGLQAALMDLAHLGGYQGRRFQANQLDNILKSVQAAFSTMGVTDVFNNVANKNIRQAFTAVEQEWNKVAATRNVSDFKQAEHIRLSMNGEFEEVGNGGELKNATVGDDKYTTQANTYGKIFSISRTDIINDDMGVFNDIGTLLGRGGAQALNNQFWGMVDSMTFDVSTETGQDLTYDNLSDARDAFVEQTGSDGHILGVRPQILLVHHSLDVEARRLMNPTNIIDGTNTNEIPNRHPLQGAYDVVSSVYLSEVGGELPWRLIANPNDLPAYVVSFLNGRQQPTVEQTAVDFNQLGIQMRGYFDFGVDEAEDQAGVLYTESTA